MLFDVDKHGDDRSQPSPNSHDVVAQEAVMAKATQGNQYAVNQLPSARINVTNNQILTFDGTANRVQITPTQMKVSQPGVDVTSATNSQLIFNSNQDVFKVVSSGTALTNAASATATAGTWSSSNVAPTTVVHGLGFAPVVIAYINISGVYQQIPWTGFSQGFTNLANFLFTQVTVYADATAVYFSCQVAQFGATTNSQGPYTVKYYLLQETAN